MGKSFRKNSDNNKQANHRNFVSHDMIESGNFLGRHNGPRRAKNVDIESDYSDYDSDDERFYR